MAVAVLEILGPRSATSSSDEIVNVHEDAQLRLSASGANISVVGAPSATAPKQEGMPAQPHNLRPGRSVLGPIADPDLSLMEVYDGEKGGKLPRISADGRAPMAEYAAGFATSGFHPKVGILIAGIGMSEAASMAAITELPGAVSMSISPYAGNLAHLLDAARKSEHEYLLSVPMEPQGYPVNDPDDRHALMASLSPLENLERLRWILSRITGYVGVTSALGNIRGERLIGMPDQLSSLLGEIDRRGLLFIDARPGQSSLRETWNRSIDIVIDDGAVDANGLDIRLDLLTHLALDKGSAIGMVQIPRPAAIERILAWTNTLRAKSVMLAPISALVEEPAGKETIR
jgi:polysaccharide deacetylase 2 family uncharacterized protein YibQ